MGGGGGGGGGGRLRIMRNPETTHEMTRGKKRRHSFHSESRKNRRERKMYFLTIHGLEHASGLQFVKVDVSPASAVSEDEEADVTKKSDKEIKSERLSLRTIGTGK